MSQWRIITCMIIGLTVAACATQDPKKMTRSQLIDKKMKELQVDKKLIQFNTGIMPFGRFQLMGRLAKHACGDKIKMEGHNQHDSLKELRIAAVNRGANSFFMEDCTLVPQTGEAAGCAKKFKCVGRAVNLKWTKNDACKLYANNYQRHFAMVMEFLKFSDEKQYRQDFNAYAPLNTTEFQSAAFVEKKADELADAENDATDAEGFKGRRMRSKNKKLFRQVEIWQKQRKSLDTDCSNS